MRALDFYFDYLSPYAYLASLEIPALCERHSQGPSAWRIRVPKLEG